MGEVAEMMLGGILCERCGEALPCVINEDEQACDEMGIPMYCSLECAKDRGAGKDQVCPH
jgi:hypothetical protein